MRADAGGATTVARMRGVKVVVLLGHWSWPMRAALLTGWGREPPLSRLIGAFCG
jgi:hypothetical protein